MILYCKRASYVLQDMDDVDEGHDDDSDGEDGGEDDGHDEL